MSKNTLLFIGIGFHQYDDYIIEELSKRYNVEYINSKGFEVEYPLFVKFLGLLNCNLTKNLCGKYISKKIDTLQNPISKLFVVKGEYLTKEHLECLNNRYNIDRKVLYLWDSWKYLRNIEEIRPAFDAIFSFDLRDCIEKEIRLRPLFFFRNKIKRSKEKKYDLSFVGGDHSTRYEFIRKLKKICLSNGWNYSFRLLIGKIAYFKYLHQNMFSSPYLSEDNDILMGRPLSYDEYVEIVSQTRVILDMQVSGQSGLTMRTIEALAMGARLITTNESILEYEDIPKDSYLLLNEDTRLETIESFVKNSNRATVELPQRYESTFALQEMI